MVNSKSYKNIINRHNSHQSYQFDADMSLDFNKLNQSQDGGALGLPSLAERV